MRLSELQKKDIIDIETGRKIGNIIDITVDSNGNTTSFVVEKYKFIISRFTTNQEIEIKWPQITKIGKDVILVNLSLDKIKE